MNFRVWDIPVRLGHWFLLLSVSAAWFTRHGFGSIHEWLGYFALALVLTRVVWGFVGSKFARFSQFVTSPSRTIAYARTLISGKSIRYLGHNPLGGWMTLVLLSLVFLVCASGWLYTTDRFWGVEWVETMHRILTNILLVFIGLHITGVIYSSIKGRENLVMSMIHGNKCSPTGDDIQ